MESKTVKATVNGLDYRNGVKGQFLVANFTYQDNGKEFTLKSKAVFDKTDAVTVEQANKDKFPVTVVIEKTDPDDAGKFFYNVKSVKKYVEGEVIPETMRPKPGELSKPADVPQPTNKPVKEEALITTKPIPVLSKDEQIERAVWIKEAGECIRSGIIAKDNPVYMRYFATMALKF